MISVTSSEINTAPSRRRAPLCCMAPLKKLPNLAKDELSLCQLPQQPLPEMEQAFAAAPQFAQIDTARISRGKNGALRVILLGRENYYLRQAAAYLTAMFPPRQEPETRQSSFDDVDWPDFSELELLDEDTPESQLKNALAVLAPSMLNPNERGGNLADIEASGILIAAASGQVLFRYVLDQLEPFFDRQETPNLFIALRPEQVDTELLEELRFTYGFHVCRVGQADLPYLCRLLEEAARTRGITLSPVMDTERVIRHLRRYRGTLFEESDLAALLDRAAGKTHLETADLLIAPWRMQSSGRQQLDDMIGLGEVRTALDRLLATAVLEDRRSVQGVEVTPSCRNLAFAGTPGTGKSVTARLIAQILREEGCGTGRFVEAGREQLIGTYLGQTSPQIAQLFQQARGGVLFIDEAGALLDPDGHDSYAAEAVNALVRHMELEPETMVIFATYPEEMEQLLRSNPGLSSRIAQTLRFPDYTDAQLFEILCRFARKEQFTLPEGAEEICTAFFRELRGRKGTRFGNGREARRLFQAAKEELALRSLSAEAAPSDLALEDLTAAAQRLLEQEKPKTQKPIGFSAER